MPQRETETDERADSTAENDTADGLASRDDRLSRPTTIFVLASVVVAIVGVIVALQFFVVERLPELTEAELDRATKLWKEHGPASYETDIEIRGAQQGTVHVEVRNRVVTATARDGRAPPQWTWNAWSVPGMFETLTQDLQIAEDPEKEIQAAPGTKWQLRCEFDSDLGYPRRYRRLASGGPEVYWRVTRFVVR